MTPHKTRAALAFAARTLWAVCCLASFFWVWYLFAAVLAGP